MTMTNDSIDYSARIRDYVAQNLLFSDKGFNHGDDASFLEEGIIVSLGIIELVSFVESQFGVSVADRDLVPDNFDSVRKLDAFIRSKLSSGN
jgi:acyl carrier protein